MSQIDQKWINKAGTKYVIDFYDGNVPPYIADIDTFHLMDAAGFPSGENRDVIFKLDNDMINFNKGFQVNFLYMVDSTHLSTNVRWRMDFIGHDIHDNISNVISYSGITTDLAITINANILDEETIFTIPSGTIGTTVSEVECRITRKGADSADTFTGDFGLKQIVIVQL